MRGRPLPRFSCCAVALDTLDEAGEGADLEMMVFPGAGFLETAIDAVKFLGGKLQSGWRATKGEYLGAVNMVKTFFALEEGI